MTITVPPPLTNALRTVAVNGSYTASRALSKWLRRGVRLTGEGFKPVPIAEAAAVIGEPEELVAAVHLPLTGDVGGHMLLTFPESVACKLVDMVMRQPDGTTTTLGEIEQSCLQETGNIVCSAYANSLSKWLKLHIEPGVPEFAFDMVSAIVDPLLGSLAMHSDSVFAAMTDFLLDSQRLQWGMLLLPSPESLKAMEERCNTDEVRQHALQTIAINGAFEASRAVSKWLKRGVKISTEGFTRVPLQEVGDHFDETTPLVAMHLPLGNSLHGHALLCVPLPHAMNLVDLLMGQPAGTTTELGELERSALEETGNIIASSFMNSWANWLDISIEPKPPQFIVDLPSAVLDAVIAEQALIGDDVLLARTDFIVDEQWIEWVFMLLPSPSSMRLIESSCH